MKYSYIATIPVSVAFQMNASLPKNQHITKFNRICEDCCADQPMSEEVQQFSFRQDPHRTVANSKRRLICNTCSFVLRFEQQQPFHSWSLLK